MRWLERGVVCVCMLALIAAGSVQAAARLITGELKASDAEGIYVPQSDSNPVVLRYLAPEGSLVEPGDVLLRIDPGAAASQVDQLRSQLEVLKATVAKDLAALEVAEVDAELVARQAAASLAKAAIDAKVPAEFRSRLDYDRLQGEHLRAEQEAALKQVEWRNANEAVTRKRVDSAIEIEKLQNDLVNAERQVSRAEQRARSRGRVLYGFDPWQGRRYQEGSTAYSGHRVGDVIGQSKLDVVAYALEPDRAGLKIGAPVLLRLDALPEALLNGKVQRISGAPEPRSQWGDGRYFTIDIAIESEIDALGLLPGMSVQVELPVQDDAPQVAP
ncbi:HlyD family secretion protein [Pseudomarimonas arenosa]|uniref:HlyD family efflux transporter periplasmic adaptor subunit n=1 Tax=Pseudomarimonas arenosa TaxID=2774145 RepID=A0AAW3ZM44_9GAMM|nr:HlyD family efflux transporter periplasmic adaptor subunit [Pseudomarimonas arenosa]MBD8525742.1 HlyD family efflux transporter periplasmic adaptor subunit [Pseudomarimonas arenosa]